MGALCKGTSRSDVTTCHTPAMGTGVPALPITCCQLLLHGFSSLPSLLLFFWTSPPPRRVKIFVPVFVPAGRDLGMPAGTWGCGEGRGGGSSPPPTAPAPRLLFTHRHVCEPLPCSEIIGQKSKAVKIFHCPQEGLLSCRGCDTQHTPADPRRRCAPVCPSVRSRPPSVQNAALALCDLSPLRAAEAPERCRRSSRSCPTRTGIPQIPHAGRCEQGCASV